MPGAVRSCNCVHSMQATAVDFHHPRTAKQVANRGEDLDGFYLSYKRLQKSWLWSTTSHLKLSIAGPGVIAQLVKCMSRLEFSHQQHIKLGRVVPAFDLSTQKVEARGSDFQNHTQLYSICEPILDYSNLASKMNEWTNKHSLLTWENMAWLLERQVIWSDETWSLKAHWWLERRPTVLH